MPTPLRRYFTRSHWPQIVRLLAFSLTMARVTMTLLAARQLGMEPALHAKLLPILGGILDTAIEARKLNGGLLPVDPPMSMHLDGHTVWYALDLERQFATVLAVEPSQDYAR